MKRYIYLFAVSWLAHAALQAQTLQATVSLSVRDAVALALANNADVVMAIEQVRHADYQVREAREIFCLGSR
ncbi:hypothetical protein [Dawidia soli]|uniref:TolC family protein n=1 Tax=Dawidia soli TaxID=2782352 RepID=A0AAP2DJN9_9BACT|nr:hypothetical protein [Dawidia soli]MBT1690732.1 hypothetical protein [Dawidia soli]